MEPASPDSHTNDSVFNAQQDETLENLTTQCRNEPLQSPVVIKAEPTSPEQSAGDSVPDARQEDLASQAPKGEHGAAAPNKAVRRIVITSDELPVFTSDQIKAGIEAFLIENNIPNNFSKDEVIKLHWDGRNLSTFHFRDMNSNRSPSPHPPPDVPVPQKIKPNILRGNKLPNASAGIEPSDTATVTVLAGGQTGSGTTPPKVNTLPERSKVSTSEPAMPCGYRAIRVKCVADSDKVVVAPLGPVSTTRDNISAEKQLCFMPRAIRYINKTGEVIEKPLNPRQQVLPFVPPMGTKVAPIQTSATSSSPAVPVVSSDSLQQTTAKLIQTKPAKPMPIVAERPSVPVTVSRVVRVNAESHNPKPRGLDASLPQGLVGSVNMPQAPLQRPAAYSTVCDDDTTRILEPEVLLKVSNKVIQVQPLKAGLDTSSSSSSSSTSSCCSEDWAPTTQMHRKQRGRKRAAPRSSIQREYRSRKRRRRVKKENSPAPQLDAKPSKSPSDEMNVNILSSNCIDRPCVVSMYHLNDRLMTKGFVNLASIKHKELFALARTPEVRLAPGKVVSVVKLNPCKTEPPEEVAITHVSESLPREMETDSLESLLREQMNHLVHLRKKYKQSGP
ncbi:hypothetical protein V5799_016820 [Amblyomma americanum]|uniref:Uncharacterized protein n=1 Tax=Amblyomma americanum TaxID=6943 RepID=A0AAQ4F417_AMBAM